MGKGKTVLFLSLIILSVFLFFFFSPKSDASLRDVQIIDERQKIIDVTSFTEDEEIVIFGDEENELYQDSILFLREGGYRYTKYLISDSNFLEKLDEYKRMCGYSEGMSSSFRYYPLIFIKEKAFSGFNSVIKEEIEKELKI